MFGNLQGCGKPWSREVRKCKVPSITSSFPASTPRVLHSKHTSLHKQHQNPNTTCHRKVLKYVVDNNCWMPGNSQPDDHISNRALFHFDSYDKKLSRHTNPALNTTPMHNKHKGENFLCN